MPVRESPGAEQRTLGAGTHCRENVAVLLAHAFAGRGVRIRRVDARQSLASRPLCRAARRQAVAGRAARVCELVSDKTRLDVPASRNLVSALSVEGLAQHLYVVIVQLRF